MARSKSEPVTQRFLHSRPVIGKNSKHLSLAWTNKSHYWKMYFYPCLFQTVIGQTKPQQVFKFTSRAGENLWSFYRSHAAIETWKHLIFVYLALPLSFYLPHYSQWWLHWAVCYPAACYGGIRISSFSDCITGELLASNWYFSLSGALIAVSLQEIFCRCAWVPRSSWHRKSGSRCINLTKMSLCIQWMLIYCHFLTYENFKRQR